MVLTLTAISIVTQERARLDLQQRRPRLHRDALRLRLAVEQQRQRLRRLRADELQRRLRHGRDAARPLRADVRRRSRSAARSRRRRSCPASAGTFRTDGPTFVVLLVGVIALTAGLMILPALTLGPDRRRTDALMKNARQLRHRHRRHHRGLRLRLPARDDRLRAGGVHEPGEGQPDHGRRQGRRLEARRPGVHERRGTSTSARRRRRPPTTPARRRFANLGPTNPDLAKNVAGSGRRRSSSSRGRTTRA